MKIKSFLLPVLLVLCSFSNSGPVVWKLDAVHSNLGFSIIHFAVSDLKGTVKLTDATITAPNEDFSDATITLKADMNSIDTDNDKRDAHLRTPDFFDTAKFPDVVFESSSFRKTGTAAYTISGNLTLHGITKPINLTATMKSGINPTNNKPITAFKVSGSIKRTDFSISADSPESILSDAVAIEANLEFGKE